jgi:hypothetical protein
MAINSIIIPLQRWGFAVTIKKPALKEWPYPVSTAGSRRDEPTKLEACKVADSRESQN